MTLEEVLRNNNNGNNKMADVNNTTDGAACPSTGNNQKLVTQKKELLQYDYLVVGAGTAGMSFIDTMLTENPKATIVLVDKNTTPGGHWTKADDFARLHQPSCFYGVNSLPLGKHQSKKSRRRERYDLDDRATKAEILDYYQTVLRNFEATGRVRSFFGATYDYNEDQDKHTIHHHLTHCGSEYEDLDGDDTSTKNNIVEMEVKCHKVVTVGTDVTVPSMRKLLIPVDKTVASSFVPVNEVSSRVASGRYNHYIVFGNGKTSIDAITHMLGDKAIDPSQITWIVSQEAWYMVSDGYKNLHKAMVSTATRVLSSEYVKKIYLGLENDGLDYTNSKTNSKIKNHQINVNKNYNFPSLLKGASVTLEQLDQIRSVKNVLRLGSATSIGPHTVHLERGSLEFPPQDTLLVDCMAENCYGYTSFGEDFQIFEPNRINLGPSLGFFNISLTSAVVAFLEASLGGSSTTCSNNKSVLQKQNDCCYFMRGKHADSPEMLAGMMYTEAKYTEALMKNVPGAVKFLMKSRVNMNAPMHQKHGTAKSLWSIFGPAKMYKFPKQIVHKVESGGYTDIDHLFGNNKNTIGNNITKRLSLSSITKRLSISITKRLSLSLPAQRHVTLVRV